VHGKPDGKWNQMKNKGEESGNKMLIECQPLKTNHSINDLIQLNRQLTMIGKGDSTPESG
jgi:hypothetical protein